MTKWSAVSVALFPGVMDLVSISMPPVDKTMITQKDRQLVGRSVPRVARTPRHVPPYQAFCMSSGKMLTMYPVGHGEIEPPPKGPGNEHKSITTAAGAYS